MKITRRSKSKDNHYQEEVAKTLYRKNLELSFINNIMLTLHDIDNLVFSGADEDTLIPAAIKSIVDNSCDFVAFYSVSSDIKDSILKVSLDSKNVARVVKGVFPALMGEIEIIDFDHSTVSQIVIESSNVSSVHDYWVIPMFKTSLLNSYVARGGVIVINLVRTKDNLYGIFVVGISSPPDFTINRIKSFIVWVSDALGIAIDNIRLRTGIQQKTKLLERANAKLVALDETKDDFISMASHQLRTPLTSIKGYISMIIEGDAGKITDDQKKMLDQAYASSQRMVYLISDLLNLSRIRTGKFTIEAKPINLSNLIHQEIEQLQILSSNHGLKLTHSLDSSVPYLDLDETKTRQVIMNFIDNSIYYTPSGGSIHVELKQTPRTVSFTVTDTGIGVPKSEQHQLFTKFFRAHNARRARPDGTGLGLFMAKKVIIAQNGSLIFRSKEGKGSTFGFIFPVG